jgi:UDP-glucose 4-epimerase
MKKRVLVTGADGLIGSNVMEHLYLSGIEPVAIYKSTNSNIQQLPWEKYFIDLLDSEAKYKLDLISGIECLVHCAAVIPFSWTEQEEVATKNLIMDQVIIHYCIESQIKIIYMSSTSVYNDGQHTIMNENIEPDPQGSYSNAKNMIEQQICSDLANNVILRICAPYGPNQRAQTVLKTFIENALNNRDLRYFGSGERSQDFIHTRDVTRAVNCVLEQEKINGIYNIVGGNPISMKALAQLVVECIPGTSSRVVSAGIPDPQEEYRALFDNSKARIMLNWRPSVSLREGIFDWAQRLRKNENSSNI